MVEENVDVMYYRIHDVEIIHESIDFVYKPRSYYVTTLVSCVFLLASSSILIHKQNGHFQLYALVVQCSRTGILERYQL